MQFGRKRSKDYSGSKVVYTYSLGVPIGQGLLDRISSLAKFDLKSTDGRFQLTTPDGNTLLRGMLGAFKLRVALAPDNPTFIHSLEAILTRNEQDPQPSGSFERYPKGTAPCP